MIDLNAETEDLAHEEGEVDPFHTPEGELIEDVNPEHERRQRRKKVKVAPTSELVFGDATKEAEKNEAVRELNRLVGLLIGPKNLEKLLAFGYDVVKVSEKSLTPSVAHRGMTE